MGVLTNLEPQKVFAFFEDICGIPHGSGNIEKISDYLVEFAKERNLEVIQDAVKNVIIIKEATPGYEKEPVMVLQGHMDMVAVKKPDCDIDMQTEGLRLAVDGDDIYAEGTSLGGDDGIAVAYALALLDSDDIKHPRLEVIITVDEETGMDGAREIDLSMLKGNRLLNLDSEDEGIFLTSCAGGARAGCELPLVAKVENGILVNIQISGLQGGHSGVEIHHERGNSNCLMGRVLWNLQEKAPIQLVSINGGLADNAIPRETKTTVLISTESDLCKKIMEMPTEPTVLDETLEDLMMDISDELATKDPDFKLSWNVENQMVSMAAVSVEDTQKAASFLIALPNGVQQMSADVKGLVETSLNMGMLKLKSEGNQATNGVQNAEIMLEATFAVRSSVESAKLALLQRLKAITAMVGGKCSVVGNYPGWVYRVDSPLREKMIKVYEQMYGKTPKVEAIHAGLECGILGSKIKDLDCVSIGPDMKDIHTTEERLSISSTKRVWEYVVKLLETRD